MITPGVRATIVERDLAYSKEFGHVEITGVDYWGTKPFRYRAIDDTGMRICIRPADINDPTNVVRGPWLS